MTVWVNPSAYRDASLTRKELPLYRQQVLRSHVCSLDHVIAWHILCCAAEVLYGYVCIPYKNRSTHENERSSKKWFHNPNSQEPERRSVKTRGYRPCRRQSGWLGQDDVTQSSWAGCQASPSMRREKSRYWDGSNAMPQTLPYFFLLAEGKSNDIENY